MENPNASQTTIEAMTAKVRAFPCVSCGAKMAFSPGSDKQKCPYCGAENDIETSTDVVKELDLEEWMAQVEKESEVHAQEQIKCTNCNGEQVLAANVYSTSCTFCGSPLTSKSVAQRKIKPRSLIPFKVTKLKAQDAFRSWIRGLWLAPNALKKYAQSDGGIKGVYVPYWTYDAQTSTYYTGQRGINRTEQYRNSDGETSTRTRTDWSNVSGTVQFFHDDVLVAASKTFTQATAPKLNETAEAMKALTASGAGKVGQLLVGRFGGGFNSWNTKELIPFQEEYIANFQTEAYQIGLKTGFGDAKRQIEVRVQQLICEDIGGDQQRVTSSNTQYSHLTFKHILLPIWVSAYLFSGKTYRFLVNGQTGEVVGESPKSAWKIFFLVCAIILGIIILLAVFGGSKHR
jgi:predicted RNA-binding Zn-ribbon protein involved in translation (DUF1610 family)